MRRTIDDIRPGGEEEIHRTRRIAAASKQCYAEARRTAIATHGMLP